MEFASITTKASNAVMTPAVLPTPAMAAREATQDTFAPSNQTMQDQQAPKAVDHAPQRAATAQQLQEETVVGMGEATAKEASSNVTPVDVDYLEKELADHPNPVFVRRLCQELREGAHIGYDGPRFPRTSRNLPTANANPQLIAQNIATEVARGRMAGPFDTPPFPNFQVSPLGIIPKKTVTNSVPFFICPTPNQEIQSILTLTNQISLCHTYQ